MQQEDKKGKELKDKKLRDKIKKDITTEDFGDKRVSYSCLDKKNKSGLGKNSRVFFLYHKQCVGYVNEINKSILLPFGSKQTLPQLKDNINLNEIEKVENQKQILIINYKKSNKAEKWEFVCPSIDSAKNWAKKINYSKTEKVQQQKNPPQNIIVENKTQNQKTETPHFPNHQETQNQSANKMQMKLEEKNQPIKIEEGGQNNKLQSQNVENNEAPKQGQQTLNQNSNPFQALLEDSKPISKPESSFFVGSTSVKNEKDQNELKQKIDIFSGKGQKFKDEYQRKKIEQKQLKDEIIQENGGGILGDIFMISTNTKLQIQKMKKEWGYEFAKSQNEYEIVEDFKKYVTAVMKKIVDELGLQQKKRYYQPWEETSSCMKYDISGVQLSLFLTQLKQINSMYEKGTMITNEESKMAAHQFKNFEYILKMTHNKGKIRVPLSMVIEYKGFTALAKVMIPSAQGYDNMSLLQKQLQILEAQSRINNSLFQDPECGKIVALQSKVYDKLARAQNFKKKFDICYVDDLRFYLPHDFNNFSKDRPYNRLRKQLIQDDDCEDQILYGEDMVALSSRLKLPQHYRDGINQLTQVSKIIYERINLLVLELESTQIFFTNSNEISNILHQYGINMRYLGTLLEKIKVSWLKEILMAEICARCAKNFLNFDLQDCLLNLSETSDEAVRKFQIKQVMNFLNKMLGNSQDSEIFWKQLNRQAQSYFKISIDKEEINQGFLIQALQTHCNFKLNSLDQQIVLFDSPAPFSISHFSSFQTKTKVYDLSFTQMYSSVRTIIEQHTAESYDQLRVLLNLNRTQHIPDHFKMSDTYDEIIKFLVNWLSPHQARDVYYPQQIQFGQVLPSHTLYQIKLAEIRWGLKEGRLEQSEKVKEWMIDHINKWIGQAHPILTELYQIYANYHLLHKEQEKKAVNYCKTAIRNQEKLLGTTHQKLADNYYLLGTVYLNYGKKSEAINTFSKAKEIIFKSKNQNSEAYGEVCLKIGQLYLAVNEPKEALNCGNQAMQIFSENENSSSLIQSIQLVCRCYEIEEDWQSYLFLIENNLIHKVADFSEQVELLERIIKVTILPSLKIISSNNTTIAQKILKVMNELPETTRAPNMAYNFLKLRIEEKVFPHRFLQVLNDIEDVLEEIQSNGMVARWKGFENLSNKTLLNKIGVNMDNKGFNFIASLEALNIFIGSSYVEGILFDL